MRTYNTTKLHHHCWISYQTLSYFLPAFVYIYISTPVLHQVISKGANHLLLHLSPLTSTPPPPPPSPSFMGLLQSVVIVSLLLYFISKSKGVIGATFTFVNKCDQTVWPGILGTPTLDTTGFELSKGTSRSFQAPTGWSGRFWGRTGCKFDGSGQGSCVTGDCGSGQIECNGSGAAPPATLAEFTLGSGSQDFYDVSLVDGYNLPMMVDTSGGSGGGSGTCGSTGCIDDLNKNCPKELSVQGGLACRSACEAFGTPEYCCKGEYGSPSTCTPTKYSQLFKSACPKSYSYAYDDASSTFTCTGADYTITFCANSPSQKSSISSNSSETGSSEEGALANGSWYANMATGESNGINYFGSVQFIGFVLSLRVLFM